MRITANVIIKYSLIVRPYFFTRYLPPVYTKFLMSGKRSRNATVIPTSLLKIMEAMGLEPMTSRVWGERSSQLSYASKVEIGGLEPLTYTLRTYRSPNWAISPWQRLYHDKYGVSSKNLQKPPGSSKSRPTVFSLFFLHGFSLSYDSLQMIAFKVS